MASNDLNPLYRTLVGFDRIASLMDQAARLDAAPGYPPFNVEQIGEDNFRIELAVAGFSEDDLNIEFKQNSLLVTGQRKPVEQRNFLHRGIAERAFELMCQRLAARTAFGKPLSEQGVWRERIAESRCLIEQARLLTMKAAWMMDTVGNKAAQGEIAMIKIVAPTMACKVIDWAIQAHGGAGVSQDTPLAFSYADQRTLRLADGPDEVHRQALAKLELARLGLRRRAAAMPVTRGC